MSLWKTIYQKQGEINLSKTFQFKYKFWTEKGRQSSKKPRFCFSLTTSFQWHLQSNTRTVLPLVISEQSGVSSALDIDFVSLMVAHVLMSAIWAGGESQWISKLQCFIKPQLLLYLPEILAPTFWAQRHHRPPLGAASSFNPKGYQEPGWDHKEYATPRKPHFLFWLNDCLIYLKWNI